MSEPYPAPPVERWDAAWQLVGLQPPDGLYHSVYQRYSEPHRTYHNLRHLDECLGLLDDAGPTGKRRGRIELALWFHDVIYDTRRSDNEKRSARWAHRAILASGGARSLAESVRDLVLSTVHGPVPSHDDARLLTDIDLAILGADTLRYDEYEEQIRREYGWVPGFVFRRKRKQVLETFLKRETIYSTPDFISRYEIPARENMTRGIAALARSHRHSVGLRAQSG